MTIVIKMTIIYAKSICAKMGGVTMEDKKIKFTDEQARRLHELFTMSDFDFFDKYLDDMPLAELAAFLNEFPDFLK